MDTKTCAKCKENKPKIEFYKMARAKDGLHSYCKMCNQKIALARYKEKGEEMREQHRVWLSRNKEHTKKYSKDYEAGVLTGKGRKSVYKSGLHREDFTSDFEFAQALVRETSKELRQRNQYYIDEIKRQPCTDCGYTFDPVCMDFDHLPGHVKVSEVGKMRWNNTSLETIATEIAKCELVCSNCHRLRTKRRREPTP